MLTFRINIDFSNKTFPIDTAIINLFHYIWGIGFIRINGIVFAEWLTDERRLALIRAGAIVGDPYHRESLTRREQGLNLRRT